MFWNPLTLTRREWLIRTGFVFACLTVTLLATVSTAQDQKQTGAQTGALSQQEAENLFEQKILPLFQKHCFECHGGGEEIRGGLVLTNREDLVAGGDSGEAIDFAAVDKSVLMSALRYEEYEMPPSGKLPAADIEKVAKWIRAGAPWKGEQRRPKHGKEHAVPQVNDETRNWWAYQPPTRPEVPSIDNRPDVEAGNPIDQFVLARLQEKSWRPNPRASRAVLVRRLYYDLTGLPPTQTQVMSFVENEDPEAYAKLVEELLNSPHYGEKWARHWLDLVRYAESNSYERDGTKPFVWRYRDYVIRSFNANKPYDQFVREQLAGDEMPNRTPEQLIATGYYRLGKWDDEPVDKKQAWFDDMDDILATTGQAFLGMTINCARCHDHKIDPIPQADYYRMLAFFRNVTRYGDRSPESVRKKSVRSIAPAALQKKYESEVKVYQAEVQRNRKRLHEIEKIVKSDFIPVEHEEFKHEMNRVPLVKKRIGKTIGDAEFREEDFSEYEREFKQMKKLRRERPKPLEAALCVTEKGSEAPQTYVMIRGNANVPGDQVEPGFPSVLSPPQPRIEVPQSGQSTGRRTALADWITDPRNPLTARVMVNRIWQHHFGRGIVRSANDFGFQGTAPTHPRLLDWLACEFMESGWDIKHMHRLICLSHTYQQSSTARRDRMAADPLNNLFWRFDMRRLTAEEVRDSILAVNGTLNKEKMFGPPIYPTIPREVLEGQSRPGENWHTSGAREQSRRSVYIHIKRSLQVPIMASFDVADTDSSCPVRFNTVQPTQALAMLNSEFINREASKFAEYVRKLVGDVRQKQVQKVLQGVFQRDPEPEEIERGLEFLKQQEAEGLKPARALELFCVVALNLNEFLYLD